MTPAEALLARELWHHIEPLHAVTYFTDECRNAMKDLGLRGFWMGYFAGRAAPMGAVTAAVVESTFFNFHPSMVRRAIPEAWSVVSPAQVVEVRANAAAAALRRLVADVDSLAVELVPALTAAAAGGVAAGRPLFAANREVPPHGDPVVDLWQLTTTLREHRGDGHVAALVHSGLDGCEVHVLFAATEGVPSELLRDSRGWSEHEWASAADRLRDRDLLDAAGRATATGHALRQEIERRTDELALQPYVDAAVDVAALIERLRKAARDVADSGEIMFPNPMGLPKPG